MRYPMGMPPWRLFPPSRTPGVSVAIPTMVPGYPHMVRAGPRRPPLHYDMGWPDANHNFRRRRGAEDQRARKHQSDQSLKNHYKLSFSDYYTANELGERCTTKLFFV